MADKIQLEIGVRAAGGVKGASGHSGANASAQERVADSRRQVQRNQEPGGKGSSTQRMSQSMESLEKTMKRLAFTMDKTYRRSTMAGGRTGTGVGGSRGGSSGGGVSGAAGRAAGTIAVVGAMIGALSYAMKVVNRLGNAHMNASLQQTGTKGITGLQRTGAGFYFGASQVAELRKSRAMESETFAGAGGSVTGKSVGVRYARKFGLGAGDVGRTEGLLSRTGGGGLGGVLEGAGLDRFQTGMVTVVRAITDELETAVRDGVSSSTLATDMAGQMARIKMSDTTLSAKAVVEIQKSLGGVSKQVGAGNVTTLAGAESYRSGKSILQRDIAFAKGGGGDSPIIEMLKSKGVLSDADISGGITSQQERFLTQMLVESGNTEVQKMTAAKFKKMAGGKTETQQIANLGNFLQDVAGINLKRGQVAGYAGLGERQGFEAEGFNVPGRRIGEPRGSGLDGLGVHSGSFVAEGHRQRKEARTLGSMGEAAARSVAKMDKVIDEFASKMRGPVVGGLDALNTSMEKVITSTGAVKDAFESVVDWVKKAVSSSAPAATPAAPTTP